MKTKSFTSMGALHPILFFAVVYIVALLGSIFICSSLFYSFNGGKSKTGQEVVAPLQQENNAATTVAYRQ